MLDLFKNLLGNQETSESVPEIDHEQQIQIATCALFIEVANSDDDFTEDEKKHIIELMKDQFGLNNDEVNELIELSEEQIKESVSLYEFTEIIDKNFSREEKLEVVEQLWKLIYLDDQLHQYEDYFIRRICSNLHLEHEDLIAAKLSAKRS